MEPLEQLIAIESIKTLKARYFRYVDTQDWRAFRQIFSDDAVLEFQESMDKPVRIADFMGAVEQFLSGAVSVHHGYLPEINIESAERATGIWAMDDQIFFPDRADTPGGMAGLRGFGHYHEVYVCTAGKWLISSLRLTRLRLERMLRPQVIA